MLNVNLYEGKNYEETLNKALEELGVTENDVIINNEEVEGSLFKSKKNKISIVKKSDLNEYIKNYLKKLCELMNVSSNVEIREQDNIYNIQLISDNNAILIGKDGRSINAIQILLRQSIENILKQNVKINVDVANYKSKKMKSLEHEIKNIAKEILESKVDVSLDPMNSYERRIVHTIISEYDNLETESTGEGKDRHVVIKYIGK